MKEIYNSNKVLFVGTVLSCLYIVYAWINIIGLMGGSSSVEESFGTAIGVAIIFPHLLVGSIGSIFNIFGLIKSKKGFILTSAILYCTSIALCIFWAFLLIPGMVLIWVGFAKFKN
jgi:hypothetical protein